MLKKRDSQGVFRKPPTCLPVTAPSVFSVQSHSSLAQG